jgi:SAM-dependent methyltransferase
MNYNGLPEPKDGLLHFPMPRGVMDVFDIAMIRHRPEWSVLRPSAASWSKCVQLGGGRKKIEDWIDLDYPEWDAETMGLPYEDESVDEFLSLHALDHMTPRAVQDLLAEVQRCLKPHGKFTIVVPHFLGALAWECIEHKSRFGLKTWRNILDNPAYTPINMTAPVEWKLKVGFNMIMGVEERNLVLVTQLHKEA